MVDVNEVKNRIINFLKAKGPSLPIQISKELRMDTIIISAFLGELLNEKKIKTSNLRVGGTPLYLLQGWEPQLENFQKYLHPKEQDAFLLLKNSGILKDSEQEPAIRVALRAIKDFAFAFKKDDEIYWRYLALSEEGVRNLLEPENLKKEIKEEIKKNIEKLKENETNVKIEEKKVIETGDKQEALEKPDTAKEKEEQKIEKDLKQRKISRKSKEEFKQPILPEFQNPLAIKITSKPEKIKPKSEFVLKVIEFLNKNKFKIIKEKEYKAKEYNCITQMDSELGPINFITQAKDKKIISDSDLDSLLRASQSIPLPALMLYTGSLSKKAFEYKEEYYSILKTKKII